MVMGWLARTFGRGLSYDGTESRGRRRPPPSVVKQEELFATDAKRRTLTASAADLRRNYAIAAWAIRKHLDYTTSFTLQASTSDPMLNAAIESLFDSSTPAGVTSRFRFDAARRHPLRRAIRLAEATRLIDGDCGWLKLKAGSRRGTIQAIEGDRIYDPGSAAKLGERWLNGVRVDNYGAAIAYAICKRNVNSRELDRVVPASSMLFHAGYDRFDQVRGVSPIASALNWFRDTYEGFEYHLAKTKVAALFGLSIYRDADSGAFPGQTTASIDTDADDVPDAGYTVDMAPGPFMLDLDPGDRAEILEAATPATETVNFLQMMIAVALKSLDIPYSFFDESFTNFYGSRGGLIQYLKSCKEKIRGLQELLGEWTRWRLGLAIADGELILPAGFAFEDLRFEWVPDGVPWWDPSKEVKGHLQAVDAGFTSPQRVCRETGTDFETNLREIAEAQRLAAELGVTLTYSAAPATALAEPEDELEDDPIEDEGNDNGDD